MATVLDKLIATRAKMRQDYNSGVVNLADVINNTDAALGECIDVLKTVRWASVTMPELVPAGKMQQVAALCIAVCAEAHGVTIPEIKGQGRTREVAEARRHAMYLARELCPAATFEQIGAPFSNRHHSTVLWAVNKVRTSMHRDATIRDHVTRLRARAEQMLWGDVRETA